jgi:hemerythrin superfamily protein
MNAIELLRAQHRQVERLFGQMEEAREDDKRRLFLDLADSLAIHTAIEERHFYPAVRARQTEELVSESMRDHQVIKRKLVDLLRTDVSDETFAPKIASLEEEVTQHVTEEEGELFPRVEALMDADQLEGLAQEMIATAAELAEEEPRAPMPEPAPTMH